MSGTASFFIPAKRQREPGSSIQYFAGDEDLSRYIL